MLRMLNITWDKNRQNNVHKKPVGVESHNQLISFYFKWMDIAR